MSVENLQRLQVGLQVGTIPADVIAWLERGLDTYLAGAGDLETCLNLKARPGKRYPPSQIRYTRRDEIVHRLAQGLDGSAWEQAGILAGILQDYAANHFPKPVLNRTATLWEAERHELPIPRSQSQLYRILTGRRD